MGYLGIIIGIVTFGVHNIHQIFTSSPLYLSLYIMLPAEMSKMRKHHCPSTCYNFPTFIQSGRYNMIILYLSTTEQCSITYYFYDICSRSMNILIQFFFFFQTLQNRIRVNSFFAWTVILKQNSDRAQIRTVLFPFSWINIIGFDNNA